MVDVRALALAVGTVSAGIAGFGRALVKVDAVVLQGVDEHLDRAGYLALGIGVLHAQKQNAAGLVRHALCHETLHQIAQMDKTGRGRRHTRDDRALGQFARRETLLKLFRRSGNVREKKLCKPCCIHGIYL